MKKLALTLIVLITLNAQAQRNVEKEVAYQGQPVTVEFAFASDIEMKTWNRSSIKIEALVDTEDKKYTEQYELQVNSSDSKIEISSNMKDLLEGYHVEFGERNELKQEIYYTLYVPKGVKLELSSVTGSMTSEFLQGDFKLDLVIGNVQIERFKGNLELNSVTGKISLPVKNSSYKVKTVMGNIYNNDSGATKEKGFVGQEVFKELHNSQSQLTLNSVTGDIYLN
ncbi:hypothetical protein [Salinimicrobium sp. HB62]|uniref:hypothetical protein n=1 Tax=Salinimicrobium sp. HB62 TaxID=3077781 RepID=UPI002D76D0E0|nr:hypothetical protein [Salinimicrobium sp. HB62]